MTGALVSNGVATFDVPRAVQVVSSNSDTAVITVKGTDVYGQSMSEALTLNGTTVVPGKKAFKTVTLVTNSAAIANLAKVGTTDILGLPIFVPDSGYVRAEISDGKHVGSGGSVQVPFQINSVDLLAGNANNFVSPIAGNITKATAIVAQSTITTGGNISVSVGTTAVTGLTLVFADGALPGATSSDTPTSQDSTTVVAVGSRIQVTPDASFATSGNVNGFIEIAGLNGTFVAGIRLAGGSTTTSGDVRGTYKPAVACDGSAVIQLIVAVADRYAGMAQNLGT
jgi:hypothetical protein